MSLEDVVKNRSFVAFVPDRLAIPGRGELDLFPLNVLFAQYKMSGGKKIMGSALYEPDLSSFESENKIRRMHYPNAYGGNSRVIIEYDSEKKSYTGTKIVDGENAGMAEGREWRGFFVHLTMMGLSNGERCEFQEVG